MRPPKGRLMGWLAGIGILGAAAVMGHNEHGGQPPSISPEPGGLIDTISGISGTAPEQTPGMSDKDWFLALARHWQDNGIDVTDESECQGQSIAHWRGHPEPPQEKSAPRIESTAHELPPWGPR